MRTQEDMMQERNSFRLVVRRGPQPNQIYEITKDVTTLGRDITNDIVINDREASRHHLRLVRSGDSMTVEDLGSTNGTFVNGKRVSGMIPLQNGDMIGLGETVTLGVEVQRPAQSAPPPPPAQPLDVTSPENDEAYAPPPPAPPQQQQNYGYQQPPPQPAEPYAPPASDPYPQQEHLHSYDESQQQPDYYGQADASYGTPAPPQQYSGYDYDPYAVREEGPSTKLLVLGCLVLPAVACICVGAVGLFAIDAANLWCEAPIVSQIVSALGYCTIGG
jgi:pSer/pThr/pTyr-binding forkhead associated (FHA) protein